ncbi:MAG: hypothetical protein RL485_618, partial [Bacteroidota bacterium]
MAPINRLLAGLLLLSAWGAASQSLQLKRADKFTVVNAYGRSVT